MANNLLIHHHVNCILESRLLLDEDIDVILTYLSPFKSHAVQDDKTILRNTICCTSCLTGLYFTYKYNSVTCAIVSSIPLGINVGLLLKNKLQHYYYKSKMEELIKSFTEVHMLNRSIINYLQTRNAISSSCKEKVFYHISDAVKEFLGYFSSDMIDFLKPLKSTLQEMLSEMCEKVDYSYLEGCDLDQFKFEKIDGDSECLTTNIHKIIDITILLISNYLSCLAVTFLNKNVQIGHMFNKHVVGILKNAKKTVKCITGNFDALRYHINTKNSYKNNEAVKKIPIKISQPLSKLLTHMQITFEMTQTIYNQLLEQDDLNNIEDVNAKLLELKNHFNACGDFLDSFIKMFGILFKNTIHKGHLQENIRSPEIMEKESTTEIIHWDDNNEPEEDEEYDMYIDKDFVSTESNYDYVEESNDAQYLSLIIQELQQSLKERQAILASRKKKYKVIGQVKKENKVSTILLPTPPPPPLPSSVLIKNSLQDTNNEKGIFQNDKDFSGDFVNAIRSIAQQRTRQEETFGDDFESDNETS